MSAPGAARPLLESLYRAALARVDPAEAVSRALARRRVPEPPARLALVATGKAALPMARAAHAWAGDRIGRALVVTHADDGGPPLPWPVHLAGHPVPDGRSEAAARSLETLARELGPGDRLLFLLSGGSSALLSAPLPGLALEDLVATTRVLLASGADIAELNTVRKHLAAATGGRVARWAHPARVEVLVVSDVPGDALDTIASGPCAADPTRFEDALAVLARRDPAGAVPASVRRALEEGSRGGRPESVAPGDPALAEVEHRIVACNRDAREAARAAAEARGLGARDRGEALQGEARELGRRLAQEALARPAAPARLDVLGGETTVTVRGRGRGGRSHELALAAALAWDGHPDVALLAAGTDGADGDSGGAGAFVDGGTCARGRAHGGDPQAALAANDSGTWLALEGGQLRTGPTGTNVMDLALLLRGAPRD